MADYSNYQKKVISRYYDNRPQIDQQRLAELVTNLYLGKPGKQMDKNWLSAKEIMERLGVPEGRVEHVCKQRDPTLLGEVVQDIQNGKIKPKPKPKSSTKKPSE